MKHPLDGLTPKSPPTELRARVLAAAHVAALEPRHDWWDRLYGDSRFWTAAATVAAALVIVVAVPPPGGGRGASEPIPSPAPTIEGIPAETSGASAAVQWPDLLREILPPSERS